MTFLEAVDLADAEALLGAIENRLPGIVTTAGGGDRFLFHDPDGVTDPARRFPVLHDRRR
jgi:hypothetical protein